MQSTHYPFFFFFLLLLNWLLGYYIANKAKIFPWASLVWFGDNRPTEKKKEYSCPLVQEWVWICMTMFRDIYSLSLSLSFAPWIHEVMDDGHCSRSDDRFFNVNDYSWPLRGWTNPITNNQLWNTHTHTHTTPTWSIHVLYDKVFRGDLQGIKRKSLYCTENERYEIFKMKIT